MLCSITLVLRIKKKHVTLNKICVSYFTNFDAIKIYIFYSFSKAKTFVY